MGFHGSGWWSYLRYDEEQDRPEISRALLQRVWEYARPYWRGVLAMLVTILGVSLFSLIPPLLMRNLIDVALPTRDFARLNLLALGMVLVPVVNGLLGVGQRYAGARIGEGITFDPRGTVYSHMQRMSPRLFTQPPARA